MQEFWENAIVTNIRLAIYVAPDTARITHQNRPAHGFVINDSNAEKIIRFSDGTVLHTGPNEVHYLPKGSSYSVEIVVPGGCWAINFDLLDPVAGEPFSMKLRNSDAVLKIFKDALEAWGEKKDLVIRSCVYDILIKLLKEREKSYVPSAKDLLIKPAIDLIHRDFSKNYLSVAFLAELCGISQAYFRRIFLEKYSVSPKAYVIRLRMEYAGQLLESGQFSVSSVAQMCGYMEPCHFSREFKKYFDMSPIEYFNISRS